MLVCVPILIAYQFPFISELPRDCSKIITRPGALWMTEFFSWLVPMQFSEKNRGAPVPPQRKLPKGCWHPGLASLSFLFLGASLRSSRSQVYWTRWPGGMQSPWPCPFFLPFPPPFSEVPFLGQRKWMGWGDWLSSHPFLGPESGDDTSSPTTGLGQKVVPQRKCLESLPGTRTLHPPTRVPSPVTMDLSSTTFPAIVLERTEPPSLALPLVPVSPPVTLSCPTPVHPATQLPHPGLSRLAS